MADETRRNMNRRVDQPYAYGNTAVQPSYDPEKKQGKRAIEREALERVEEKVRESRLKNRVYSTLQLGIIAFSLACILVIGAFYLLQISSYRSNKNKAASLEKQLQQTVKDNALLENSYESRIDYAGIYEYASGIGMSTPGKQQIITYKRLNEEYVEKDGEIPNE